jgi:hypothetical protein
MGLIIIEILILEGFQFPPFTEGLPDLNPVQYLTITVNPLPEGEEARWRVFS